MKEHLRPREEPVETASVWMQVRVRPSEKARWEAQAKREGLTLSKWAIQCMNEKLADVDLY